MVKQSSISVVQQCSMPWHTRISAQMLASLVCAPLLSLLSNAEEKAPCAQNPDRC